MTNPGKTIRCAIYTRKSSEEGLDQSFNSLHAQREACEAYVLSQKHEGWQPIGTEYDDGGFSGGNMERPGLKKLLADITAGKVDTVVVYKVDRLTRSLADFAKIVESFDGKGVSFVSVTQQFNTTSSMGRLTLNVLLSFAQFEREVTGERIRDKVAASKKKGMWMGGHVPLGYELEKHQLVVNEDEATTVRDIFNRYLRLGSVTTLQDELMLAGVRSKRWTSATGKAFGGAILSRGTLYHLLSNPVYIGKTRHKTALHPGKHKALLDLQTWTKVADLLKENRVTRRRSRNLPSARMLLGKLVAPTGDRYTPTHSAKGGRRYFYYAVQGLQSNRSEDVVRRLPAVELEECVVAAIRSFLADSLRIAGHFAGLTLQEIKLIISVAKDRAAVLTQGSHRQQCELVRQAVNSVIILRDQLRIDFDVMSALGQTLLKPEMHLSNPVSPLILEVPLRIVRRGSEVRLILLNGEEDRREPIPSLVRAITQSQLFFDWIIQGDVKNLNELSKRAGINRHYTARILRLTALSPQLKEFILSGNHSPALTVIQLTDHVPLIWEHQRIDASPKT